MLTTHYTVLNRFRCPLTLRVHEPMNEMVPISGRILPKLAIYNTYLYIHMYIKYSKSQLQMSFKYIHLDEIRP